jgi:hypothetical protein
MKKSLENHTAAFCNLFAALVAAFAIVLLPVQSALAADSVQIVTEEDVVRQLHGSQPTNEWVIYTRDTGTATFRAGPDGAPLGVGSLELTTTTSNDKVYAFNYEHIGTSLAAINAISYSTYRTAGSAQQVTALNLEVDVNGSLDGGYTVLVFEPVYNTNQGAVENNVWQTWDAYSGGSARWWSSRDIPGVCAFDCFVAWEDILEANPDATIVGGFGVNQGGGNPGLTGAVDALQIGYGSDTVTYNFEPFKVPVTADDCKNDGWQTLKRADGTSFKNQGDCIQYVNTGK